MPQPKKPEYQLEKRLDFYMLNAYNCMQKTYRGEYYERINQK
jgi:hypothetical protein